MDKLRTDFPQARFVFQSFPLPQHPWAPCRGLSGLHRAPTPLRRSPSSTSIYSHQREIEEAVRKTDASGKTTIDDAAVTAQLREYAKAAGADPAKIQACAATEKTSERVLQSEMLGKAMGVTVHSHAVHQRTPYQRLRLRAVRCGEEHRDLRSRAGREVKKVSRFQYSAALRGKQRRRFVFTSARSWEWAGRGRGRWPHR